MFFYREGVYELLTRVEVERELRQGNEGIILPKFLDLDILNHFGYKQVEIQQAILPIELVDVPKKYIKSSYRFDIESNCVLETYEVNNELINEDWRLIREARNTKLKDCDWVLVSEVVTNDCKNRYKIYKELLRDCINIAEYPNQVIFPNVPMIEYVKSVDKDNNNTDKSTDRKKLSDEDIERIKNHVCLKSVTGKENWNVFLTEWSRLSMTRDFNTISNLIKLYCPKELKRLF